MRAAALIGDERSRIRFGGAMRAISLLAVLICAGCASLKGGPERLYTEEQEAALAQLAIEKLIAQYSAAPTEALRNEIIGRRMYIIDVMYTQYEANLTRERQEIGFGTAATATGLATGGALAASASSARILSGLSGAVGLMRGYYDSEIVIAKSLQIAQGNMRFLRDQVAKRIRDSMAQPLGKYPLSVALSDLEDYYRAGTLTAGLIKAAGEAGSDATNSTIEKSSVIEATFGPDASSQVLWDFLTGPSVTPTQTQQRMGQLNQLLRSPPLDAITRASPKFRNIRLFIDDQAPESADLRARLITIARNTGIMP